MYLFARIVNLTPQLTEYNHTRIIISQCAYCLVYYYYYYYYYCTITNLFYTFLLLFELFRSRIIYLRYIIM
jgi:hypothetical protein